MSETSVRLRLYMELDAVDASNQMFTDLARVEQTAEAFLSAPVLSAVARAQVDDRRPKKVTAKTRATIAATGKHATIEYLDCPNPGRGVFVQLSLLYGAIHIRVVVEPTEIEKHRATALDELIAAFVRCAEVWRGEAVVREGFIKAEYHAGLHWDWPRYARLRKPRYSMRYPPRSLVTFFDRSRAAKPKDVDALMQPTPAHATITTHGDLVEVRWAKSLDDDEVARASTWHDCWIRRVTTDRDSDFNELGDEEVNAGSAKPLAPLTLYNPWLKIGFKAVLVTPEGELEESAWNEALSVLKARALPSGEEVVKLWIVVPLREHAIAVHERVLAAGFEAAVYPKSNYTFSNPVPKGPWLDESTDNGVDVTPR